MSPEAQVFMDLARLVLGATDQMEIDTVVDEIGGEYGLDGIFVLCATLVYLTLPLKQPGEPIGVRLTMEDGSVVDLAAVPSEISGVGRFVAALLDNDQLRAKAIFDTIFSGEDNWRGVSMVELIIDATRQVHDGRGEVSEHGVVVTLPWRREQ